MTIRDRGFCGSHCPCRVLIPLLIIATTLLNVRARAQRVAPSATTSESRGVTGAERPDLVSESMVVRSMMWSLIGRPDEEMTSVSSLRGQIVVMRLPPADAARMEAFILKNAPDLRAQRASFNELSNGAMAAIGRSQRARDISPGARASIQAAADAAREVDALTMTTYRRLLGELSRAGAAKLEAFKNERRGAMTVILAPTGAERSR